MLSTEAQAHSHAHAHAHGHARLHTHTHTHNTYNTHNTHTQHTHTHTQHTHTHTTHTHTQHTHTTHTHTHTHTTHTTTHRALLEPVLLSQRLATQVKLYRTGMRLSGCTPLTELLVGLLHILHNLCSPEAKILIQNKGHAKGKHQ